MTTTTIPTVIGPAGLVPQAPADLRTAVVAAATLASPGLTANLPGTLIEDIASTDVAALVLCDQARVDLVDSVTPYGANAYLLAQLGAIYGADVQSATNTSVQVIFSVPAGTPAGTVIPEGFIASDGTYQYACAGGIIASGLQSDPLYCLATQTGSWAVPAGTVSTAVSALASGVVVSCTNPYPGVAGLASQTEGQFRAAVLRMGRASAIGTPSYFKALVSNVPGVQSRLVAFQQQSGGGWKAIVGGGDPYDVAYAIYRSVADISTLQGSAMAITAISAEANGLVTTALNHGYANGQVIQIQGIVGMPGLNAMPLTVAVVDEKNFRIGVNTLLMGSYQSGGILTPNFRNNLIAVQDYPDLYQIPYVSPPQQIIAITALWDTSISTYINGSAVAQLAAPAIAAVINAIEVGRPVNIYDLEAAFRTAVASVLPSSQLTRLVFEVSINGIGTAPTSGTGVIYGDPESYFWTDPSGSSIAVLQG